MITFDLSKTDIAESLGITQERQLELSKFIAEEARRVGNKKGIRTIAQILETVWNSETCKSPAERIWLTYKVAALDEIGQKKIVEKMLKSATIIGIPRPPDMPCNDPECEVHGLKAKAHNVKNVN